MASPASLDAPAWLVPSASVSFRSAVRLALISVETLPAVLARKAMLSVSFRIDQTSPLHLLAPLRSPALPGFIATMIALTPARWRDSSARSAPRGGRYLGILISS